VPRWFLSTRVNSVGGPVGPVKILDADRPGCTTDLTSELQAAIRGHEVFFATHGFDVNQKVGTENLSDWLGNLQVGSAVPIGILWPGDCVLPIFVDYVAEGREAIHSGQLLADFMNENFTSASSLCFASHSLGARVVLQTVSGLSSSLRVRRVLLMAGAIDNTCLTGEYADATKNVEEISILASTEDDVLALAYPLANPLQGVIDRGHPYYHTAIGRDGPAQPYPPAPRLHTNWQIPKNLDYGHHDYLPGEPLPDRYPPSVDIPPDNAPCPPVGTPPLLAPDPKKWKPAWSAGFASTRYK
jgi:Alpha/beta hydrolase of unknown function (DUF900)